MKKLNPKREEKEQQIGPVSLKRRKTCKKGLPHDFELTIPKHYLSIYPGYQLMSLEEFYNHYDGNTALQKFFKFRIRYYKCKVCGKEDTKHENIK